MADYVERYSGKASDELEKQIRRVYKQAAEEVQKKLDDFIRGHKARNAQMLQMVADGKLSKQDYQKWMRGQVFQGDQWKQKLKDVTDVYVHADEKAREIVGGTSKNVFMEAANYTAYDLEKGMRGAVAFNVYDAKTVERLLKDDPKMLPEWKIDQPKDYKWNEKRVRNAVAQGIIQGESVEEVGDRLTGELSTSNAKKMDMFARTAVNGAQNAGRMDRLHEAEEMGIEVRKKWLATLDQRTRDTHQALDGQEQPIDEPFVVDGMKIDYPGDPFAPPELVYNCFVGETSAYTNCEIERSYSHEYKGELIEIETSCGVKFTCTPNHPILTLDGWVSAASLHNGDDLLVTKVGNRLGFGRNCNVKHVLPCMKTFHDSFKGSGLVSRDSTLSVNFHGDIPTSEVEIITKKRFLSDNRNPGISERIKKFLFELSYKAFACKCPFMKHFWRIGFSTFSFICGKGKSFPFFWGRFGHSQKHGLRPIALFNPGGVQPLNDNVAGNIQIISNCLDGFTGIVLADNIISVNKCSGCTHVYNLQTENGYYFVNTIITKSAGKRNGFAAISHNCRCTLTYVYPKYKHLQHNHERRDQLNDKNIENMTYYEWIGLEKRKIDNNDISFVEIKKDKKIECPYADEMSSKGYVGLSGAESDEFIREHHNKRIIGKKGSNTMDGTQSRRINTAFRNDEIPTNPADVKLVQKLDAEINKNELPQDMTLFRGVSLDAFSDSGVFDGFEKTIVEMSDFKDASGNIDFDKWGKAYEEATNKDLEDKLSRAKKLIGTTIEDKGYMQVSASSQRNIFVASDIGIQIHAPKGTNAYISDYLGESEIILERGTSYRVLDATIATTTLENGNQVKNIQLIVEIVDESTIQNESQKDKESKSRNKKSR